MRIIAGHLKGRRLLAPRGSAVRPTSDALRETLFNVLGETVAGARVLDAYAGTGALGLEALSRGARHVTFVERHRMTAGVIDRNVAALGVQNACAIIRADFAASPHGAARPAWAQPGFDLVLLDPPYDAADLAGLVERAAPLLVPGGRLVLEHSRRRESPELATGVRRTRVLTAGDSALSFYVTAPVPDREREGESAGAKPPGQG
jgi:16S rRNA (guanine966-N2)-methyltransferase